MFVLFEIATDPDEEAVIEIGLEQPGIPPRLPQKEQTKGQQGQNRKPGPEQSTGHAFLRPFVARDRKHIIKDEKYDGEQYRNPQSPLLDNRAQWRPDHEHDDTGDGLGVFLIPGDFPSP